MRQERGVVNERVVNLAGRSIVAMVSWFWCCVGGWGETGGRNKGTEFLVSARGIGSAEGSIPITSENDRSLGTEDREKAKKILQAVVILSLLGGGWQVDVDDDQWDTGGRHFHNLESGIGKVTKNFYAVVKRFFPNHINAPFCLF